MHPMQKVAHALWRRLDTPRSLAASLLLRHGEIAQLQQLRADPNHYLTASSYHKDAIATDFLRKCPLPGGATAAERERKTIESFLACERKNFQTNRRLYSILDFGPDNGAIETLIGSWRKEIKAVLGRLPSDLVPRFSGGSTVSNRGSLATIPDKMTSRPTFYPLSNCLIPLWERTAWGRACTLPTAGKAARLPEVCRYNVFFVVPKDSEIDRGCCMEAAGSLAYQLATGRLIRESLTRAYGYNLRELQPVHRSLARIASLGEHTATVDLSNASNLLCRALPELVLPQEWYELVDSLRAPSCLIDGRILRLEMFSSMGNGFTFELETLLFTTLGRVLARAKGCNPDLISVYGDDIICPSELADDLLAALGYFGFEPNRRKTFVTGLFRESCGGDFFDGKPVRAHLQEKLPEQPQDWIALANGIRDRIPWVWAKDAWNVCLQNIPSSVRSCRGPQALGDIVIHCDEPEGRLRTPRGESEAVLHYRAYLPVAELLPIDTHWWSDVVLASALYGVDSSGVPVRGETSYRVGWVAAPGSSWLPSPSSCF